MKDLFTSSAIYTTGKRAEGIKSTKDIIEEVFNDIAKELAPYRIHLMSLYKYYDYRSKNNRPLLPINSPAYYYIANSYQKADAFLRKFHNLLEITEEDFLHFLYNTFILDLMCWSKYLGSSLELHIELLFGFKKLWNDERLCEDKIKLEEESDKIVMRYRKISYSVADFDINYHSKLKKQIGQFQIQKYLIYHIYIRHIKDTQIDTTGTCFPDDFDNKQLSNLLADILSKSCLEGYDKNVAYIYHKKYIYMIVFRDKLVHSFYPLEKGKEVKELKDKYRSGGDNQLINIDEAINDLLLK